jgi:hypothetical protein
MVREIVQPKSYSSKRLATIGTITLLLLVFTTVVQIRIVLERPNYGDVTDTFWTIWQGVLVVATVGSFLIAIHNTFRNNAESDGAAARFQIGGENHDIDVHFHEDDATRVAGQTTAHRPAENDTESSDVSGTRAEGATEKGTDVT